MSLYNNVQYGSRAILVEQGWPVYLLGSRDSTLNQSRVTSIAITTNVATVGISAWSGPLPAVGDIVTIRRTQTNSGLFNVSNAVITAVNLTADGSGTISFALVNANIATAADVGDVYITKAVVPEAVTLNAASMPGTANRHPHEFEHNIFCDVQFGTIPTAATVVLQTAMRNIDSDFKDAATVATVAASAVTLSQGSVLTTAPFFRFKVTALTGTATIAALVTI